jgi:phage tail sheath protein FI
MSLLLSPGVYYEAIDYGDQAMAPLRSDIAGFVGIATKGPIDTPIPIESWRQFTTWFGGFSASGFLAYSVRAFFENGGLRCWVVRVASKDEGTGAARSSQDLAGSAGTQIWAISASSEGVWGNAISFKIRERNPAQSILYSTDPLGEHSTVSSVSGFARCDLIKIVSSNGTQILRVLSDVDPILKRLYWVHPDPAKRLPYDQGVDPLRISSGLVQSVDYTIELFDTGRLVRLYEGLSLIKESSKYGPTVLRGLTFQTDPKTGNQIAQAPEPILINDGRLDLLSLDLLDVNPDSTYSLSGGADGLGALSTYDFVGESSSESDSVDEVLLKKRGLRALEPISEVSILLAPDALVRPIQVNPVENPAPCIQDPCLKNPPSLPLYFPEPVSEQPPLFGATEAFVIHSAMIDQCERLRDRFAILDPPFETAGDSVSGIAAIREWRSRFDSQFAALYYPWVKVLDPLRTRSGEARLIPPSGHVAGGFARSATEIGVHKAPANLEIQWAVDTSTHPGAIQHGVLNDEGIDVIRISPGRGIRTMGARTVSSDPSWKFVNVRRLMSMIEKALELSLQWVTFEPNNVMTRMRATMSVTLLLSSLQEAGAFAGATAAESFFVKCDPDNNPTATRDVGELIVEIGVAPSMPFEFILLRVGRVQESIAISEIPGRLGFSGVAT